MSSTFSKILFIALLRQYYWMCFIIKRKAAKVYVMNDGPQKSFKNLTIDCFLSNLFNSYALLYFTLLHGILHGRLYIPIHEEKNHQLASSP